MAFTQQSNKSDELTEQHEINVTPFIDVILVLLIIFMVAAPLATVSVPVNLPSLATPQQPQPKQPTYLTLQQDLTLVFGEDKTIVREQLKNQLSAESITPEQQIFLRADQDIPYGEFIKLMNQLNQAGYNKVALVGLESTES